MASFGQKKKLTEYLYSKPVIGLLALIVVFMGVAVYKRYTVERQMYLRYEQTANEKKVMQQRKDQLEERVDYLSGDRGIEEEIRTHFDVAKEGEKVIILVGEDEKPAEAPAAPVEKAPWYQFWR